MVSLAGLQEATFVANAGKSCGGGYFYGGRLYKCSHSHPAVQNVVDSLAYSCNSSYFQAFRNIIARLHWLGHESVVDAGCGDGFFPGLLAERLPDGVAVGLDASPAFLAAAEERLHPLIDAGRVRLGEGNGERGLRHQKDAQRLLEMAREQGEEAHEGESGEREGVKEGDSKQLARTAEIPGKDRHKGPQEFRRRVMEGLGSSGDPVLREAVKRYAEGLLR